ncbi:MAG: hypothetical protein A2901_07805 [Elusimicrobia bacterium RIFCSPLOWO2_01_FULL_54_10]|nr:MAG: hypothetical protein A2901_07805 [Elusimicrobia bacterium RIFCSPLOWO2_01_FULL_54_10]
MFKNAFKISSIVLSFFGVLAACGTAGANSNYAVGADDIIEISVLRPEKISNIVTVSPDGAISFPYIGSVFVKGMSLDQVQEAVRKRLADGFIKYPEVSVALKESKSKKIFISGEVGKPGPYPFEESMTVLKAISTAGGFAKNGSFGRGKLMRQGRNGAQTTHKLVIKGISDDPSNDANRRLEPGDTLVILEDKFFVYGDVSNPGTYSMEENVTALKAISMVGGFTKNGPSSRVRVLRPKKNESDYETFNVNIKGIMAGTSDDTNMMLEPGDTVVVSEDKFHVYGAVTKPGTYPIEENTTVLKAISMVGGFTKYGSANRVKILRPRKDKAGHETIQVNIKEIMKGSNKEGDTVLEPGDTIVVSEGMF